MNKAEIEELAALVANDVDPQTITKYRNATSADQKMIDGKAKADRDATADPRLNGPARSFPKMDDLFDWRIQLIPSLAYCCNKRVGSPAAVAIPMSKHVKAPFG